MKVQVRYFASLREALGPQESIELPAGTTTELWTAPGAPLYYDLYVGQVGQ